MSERQVTSPIPRWRRLHDRKGFYYVLPALILFAVMIAYPIARSFYLSFYNYSILEPDAAQFVGMGNYAKLFTQDANRQPFWHTLYFTAIFVPPYVLVGMLIAVMLHRIRRGTVLLRTMIFVPIVVSLSVSAVMFALLYNVNFGPVQKVLPYIVGAINAPIWLINQLGGHLAYATVPTEGVLSDANWTMPAVAFLCLWNGVGFNVILFLVGLQRIPDVLQEAAAVDGASGWKKFWHITMPQLRPTTYLVVLLSMIGALKIFGQPYILTANGGPGESTLTYVMRLYNLAFTNGKSQLGYASAMAYALAVFTFCMTLLVKRFDRPVE